jgi:metal-responsive CopG/Arc/MetJ family transcriptional regulator
MKTAVSLPDDLFQAAEKVSKRLGLSRSELYQRALSAFVDRHNDELVTETLNAIYPAKSENSRLDRLLETLQAASIQEEEW